MGIRDATEEDQTQYVLKQRLNQLPSQEAEAAMRLDECKREKAAIEDRISEWETKEAELRAQRQQIEAQLSAAKAGGS